MGLPPSDANMVIFKSKENARASVKDFSDFLKGMRFMTSGFFLTIMRPFWGKENDEVFKRSINPLFSAYTDEMDKGENLINFDAPLAIWFYGSPYTNPATF
jgi:hypothetical protein